MMSLSKKNKKILLSIVMVVIILISVFTVTTQISLKDKTVDESSIFVKIFADTTEGIAPFNVTFSSIVLNYEGNLVYKWDFGDGNTSNEMNPTHIYDTNGSYICTLMITDSSGENDSDRLEITAKVNEAPIVSITLSEQNPSRDFNLILRKLQVYTIRRFIDAGFIPKSLLNKKGFVFCYATAYSPQGNDIISYKWELRPPTYPKLGGDLGKPVYKFEGQNITIPYIYTYPDQEYNLIVIVTDSKGFSGTSFISFKVEVSSLESKITKLNENIGRYRQNLWHNWLKTYYGDTVADLIYDDIIPKIPGLTLLKLYLIFKISSPNWGISDPDGSITKDLLSQFLEKHPMLKNMVHKTIEKVISILENLKQKHPNLATEIDSLINSLEKLLEDIGISNKRPVISNPFPEHESKNIHIDTPYVEINVSDPEGDSFNVTISGKYVNGLNVTYTGVTNDTFIATLITPLPEREEISWKVEVVDPWGKIVTGEYKFTTFVEI